MNSILVVDDHAHVRRVVQLALTRAGYEVEQAVNGRDALERLRVQEFAAVVTDVNMPEMDGIALCQAIRQEFESREMVVCVVTSRPEDELRRWARDLGNVRFLEKPLSMKRLVGVLDEALRAKRAPREEMS